MPRSRSPLRSPFCRDPLKARGKKLRYPRTDASYRAMINLCTSEKIAEVAGLVDRPPQPGVQLSVVSAVPIGSRLGPISPDGSGWARGPGAHKVTGRSSASVAGPRAASIWRDLWVRNSLVDNDFDGLLNYSFLDKSFMVGYDTVFFRRSCTSSDSPRIESTNTAVERSA